MLGFFVPIVGLILWLVWMHTRPRDAKMSRNGFITGIAVAIIASIVSVALVLSAAHRIADETYLPNLPETTDTNEEYPTTIPTPDSVGQSDAGNCVWTDNQTYGVGFCADSQLLYYTDTDYDYYAATNVDVPMIMVSKMEPSQAYQPGDTPADVAYWYSTEAANPCLVLLSTPEVAAANCTSDVVGASHDAGVTFYLLNARGEMIRIDLFSGDSSHGAEQLAAAAVLNPKSLG